MSEKGGYASTPSACESLQGRHGEGNWGSLTPTGIFDGKDSSSFSSYPNLSTHYNMTYSVCKPFNPVIY